MSSSASVAPKHPGAAATLDDIFRYQNQVVAARDYEYLGRCKRIVLEAEEGARTQPAFVVEKLGHCLEWYDQPHPHGGVIRNYLPIAQTRDRRMLLATEWLMRRDFSGRLTSQVGLPDMPDPRWKPGQPSSTKEAEEVLEKQRRGVIPFPTAPMVAQDLNQLTNKIVQGTQYLVFQPIAQILFQPDINDELRATYWTIVCEFDPVNRTHPAFLVDRITGETHFYGGKHRIERVG